jgi:hypothetical protein
MRTVSLWKNQPTEVIYDQVGEVKILLFNIIKASPSLLNSAPVKDGKLSTSEYNNIIRYNQRMHKIDFKIPRRLSLKTIKQTQTGKDAINYIADLFFFKSNDYSRTA